MELKKFREFHWITKIVIGLTGLLLLLIIAAGIAQSYWMSNQDDQAAFNAGQGLGVMAMTLAWVLVQVFLALLVVIAIYFVALQVKAWIEKYLDAMLAKLDVLAEQKSDREKSDASLAAMNEKISRVEEKLDSIERILETVAE